MSMLKVVRPALKFFVRCQSQKTLDLLQNKAPIELTADAELENLPVENTIEWNKKLKSFRVRGDSQRALKLFEIGIRKHRYQPDYITYVSMIEMCKEVKDLENGRYVHRQICQSPVNSNSRIQSLLMVKRPRHRTNRGRSSRSRTCTSNAATFTALEKCSSC